MTFAKCKITQKICCYKNWFFFTSPQNTVKLCYDMHTVVMIKMDIQ